MWHIIRVLGIRLNVVLTSRVAFRLAALMFGAMTESQMIPLTLTIYLYCFFFILPTVVVGVTEFGQGEWNGVIARHGFTSSCSFEDIPRAIVMAELPTTPFNVGNTILDLCDDA